MHRRAALFFGSIPLVALVAGCDRDEAPAEASGHAAKELAAPPSAPPPDAAEPCTHAGALEAIEADPSCVVDPADPRADVPLPEPPGSLRLTLTPDRTPVAPGAVVHLRLAITNTTRRPVALVFEGEQAGAGAHADLTRVAGIAPPIAPIPEGFPIRIPLRTLDARERAVDRLPIIAPPSAPPVRLYRVLLPPHASLTRGFEWYAVAIPAPPPVIVDDAGHRFVPKTLPHALWPGTYAVQADVPLHGAPPHRRIAAASIDVVRPDPDAAAPPVNERWVAP